MKWALGAVLLLIIGAWLGLGLLVYAMYALLGVILVSRYLAWEWIGHLRTRRECSRNLVEIGEKVALVIEITNRGWLPIPWLIVEDSVPQAALLQRPPRIKLDGKRLTILQLPPRGTRSLLYQVQFLMRGYYQMGPLLLESGDLFGLHRRYRVETTPNFVMVMPKVIPLASYDVASRRPIGEVRLVHRLFEDPTRISGVRQYVPGDPLNRVHWKATARTGVLHSKTFDASSIAGATLLLDFHRDSYDPQGEPHRSELAVTAAASLANALFTLGEQVGFVTNGRDAADRIREEGIRTEFRTREAARQTTQMLSESDRLRPVIVETSKGHAQLTQILETLARLELTDGLRFEQLVMEVTSKLPRDATIIAILPGATTEAAVTLGSLKRRGFAVAAILILQDEYATREATGRLVAEGIEVRHIEDEAGIAAMCSDRAVQA